MNNKTEKESFYENGQGQLNKFKMIKITICISLYRADNFKLLRHPLSSLI